jgi:uncharacterized protein YcaQ
VFVVKISKRRARQIAVMAQLLDADRPSELIDTVSRLGFVQMDPTAVVARTEHLVLWSRLGRRYRPDDLSDALYKKRQLFESRAFIYPTADYPLHRALMDRWPLGDSSWPTAVRQWLQSNRSFRSYVLNEIRKKGPLRSRDLEDRSAVSWRSSGWTHERNVGQMLEFLWAQGKIAVVRREGSERVWDLAGNVLPVDQSKVSFNEANRALARRRLRSLGIIRPGRDRGLGVPVEVEGTTGEWVVDPELLDKRFRGRTALVSPFDRLVYDRRRLLELFNFDYKLEMYVPVSKRRWGYYVLPALRGDRLVARVDCVADRKRGTLTVKSLLEEAESTAIDIEAIEGELMRLAKWLGLQDVEIGRLGR